MRCMQIRVSLYERYITGMPISGESIWDMTDYLDKPAEVVNMFSEAIKILDEHTLHYMTEEMQKQIDKGNEVIR